MVKTTTKTIYKTISFLVILVVLFFLIHNLVIGWQNIKTYQFSFNYFFLFLSFGLLSLAISGLALAWNKILRKLEPQNRLSNFAALKIYIYSELGKYIPGKLWAILGRIYLGDKKNISKKNLFISSALDILLSTLSAIFIGLIFLLSFLDSIVKISGFLLPLLILIIIVGLIIIHPRLFYPIFNLVLRKFKKVEIPKKSFLNYGTILKIFSYYLSISIIGGLAFFLLINSVVPLPIYKIPEVIGIYNLALGLGVIAVFAPSGLGIREGVLVILLKSYFLTSMAVLISFIARIWFTLIEIILFGFVCVFSKIKKQ